jgi:S-(hydroxymethyl)glutathione dehydrogenase/alcohol dehydrogenase
MRGVIWDGQQLIVTDELTLRSLGPGEVRVKVLASGVCHTDINMMDAGLVGVPVILGHEAAGEVVELGAGVAGFTPGEAVMVGTQAPCGTCRECLRGEPENCDVTWGFRPSQPFGWKGKPVYSFANVSSFAGEIVVRASQLYRTAGIAPEQAALIGCAVSTGYYAARKLGRIHAGDRVVVFGVGGIGVNAIQAAKLAGAEVFAADVNPAKEAVARSFGADGFLLVPAGATSCALADLVRAHGPIDVAVECSGAPVAVEAAIHGVKRGGRVVLIGMAKPGTTASFSLEAVTGGREIISVMNGGARPEQDYPELIRMIREKQLDVAGQVTRIWPLAQVAQAIAALRAGEVTRAALDHTIT